MHYANTNDAYKTLNNHIFTHTNAIYHTFFVWLDTILTPFTSNKLIENP